MLLVGASSHWSELVGYVRHALPEEMKGAVPTQVRDALRSEGRKRCVEEMKAAVPTQVRKRGSNTKEEEGREGVKE